jgi:hypothetical protein
VIPMENDKITSIPIRASTRRVLKSWSAENAYPDTYDTAIKTLLEIAEKIKIMKENES